MTRPSRPHLTDEQMDEWTLYAESDETDGAMFQAPPGALLNLLAEVRTLRDVLVFADGYTSTTGYRLADLYAEDAPAQDVLRRAGCHPRTTRNGPSTSMPEEG